MTPGADPVLCNLAPAQVLARMLYVLAGELGGPGARHTSEAREHVRAALAAPELSPAYFDALAQAEGALTRAVSERPPSGHLSAREVLGVTRTPSGARLTLADGERVELPATSPYHLTPTAPARLSRLDVPALYTLPAALARPAALALGFDPQQLAALLDTPEVPRHD